jgi:ribosomal protein S18 acetylase RimI-like enzyme
MSAELLTRIGPDTVTLFKDVRLRALLDTPLAFGSTYATESLLTDADWERRATGWSGEQSVGYLAIDGNAGCGIAAGFVDRDDPTKAHLISMWVAPTHRRLGLGRTLVTAVIAWAAGQGFGRLVLHVVSGNDLAMRFYQRLGFTMTGKTEPYPNDPNLIEHEMALNLR